MSKGDNFANGALVTRVGNAKKSSEELNGISESAQEQHEMELQALFDQLELEEGEEVQFPYLVRGAELYCNCGTHKRRLNLPICHGVYTNGKPMMHEEDCEVGDDKNIPSFGICQSEENPVNKSWFAKAGDKIKDFFTGEEDTDDAEKIADMLHELPDFTDAEWAVASDAFCQDNKISYEFEQKSFNLQKENPVEVLNVHCTVQDQAKNENEADYEVTVTYTGLDVEALLEKTGLIMQIADTSTNNNSTSSNNNMTKSDGKSNKNQNGEYKGNDTVNDLGMTDAEFAAMFDSMTQEEREAFLNSMASGSTDESYNIATEQGTISYYYDSSAAQQVFSLVNQERVNNGLPELTWDSDMASYSDRRAMEIVTDFSHNSAGGKWSVGENIGQGYENASAVVSGWMNSEGHKANILSTVSTRASVSCYVEKETFSNGSRINNHYWVINFTH